LQFPEESVFASHSNPEWVDTEFDPGRVRKVEVGVKPVNPSQNGQAEFSWKGSDSRLLDSAWSIPGCELYGVPVYHPGYPAIIHVNGFIDDRVKATRCEPPNMCKDLITTHQPVDELIALR
jgi:hypothetical protein